MTAPGIGPASTSMTPAQTTATRSGVAYCQRCHDGNCYASPTPHTWIDQRDDPSLPDAIPDELAGKLALEHPCACDCNAFPPIAATPSPRASAAPTAPGSPGPAPEAGTGGQETPAGLTAARAEDVSEELVRLAWNAWAAADDDDESALRAVIGAVLEALPDFDWIPPDEYDEPLDEPDVCRPVEVDGETILIRGAGEPTEEDQRHLGSVVRAAKAAMEAKRAAEEAAIRSDERAKVAAELRAKATEVAAEAERIRGERAVDLRERAGYLVQAAVEIARGGA